MCFDPVIWRQIMRTSLSSLHTCGSICLLWKHSLAQRHVVITPLLPARRRAAHDGDVTSPVCFTCLWRWGVGGGGWKAFQVLNTIFSFVLAPCTISKKIFVVVHQCQVQLLLGFLRVFSGIHIKLCLWAYSYRGKARTHGGLTSWAL